MCFAGTLQAQKSDARQHERTIALWGHVKDHITKAGIADAKITLMLSDSTVIDTMRAFNMGQFRATKDDVGYRFKVSARPEKYIIKAEHPDYEPCFVDYEIRHVARNTYFDAPWHLMKKRQREISGGELGEVIVKATRVKMVYKGDTIVYNADAFNLPEGSMLDALIRQMDGVELKDNGQILVNGIQIDELTLNGKDFFKGNNKIMLENLPHYTVQNVMVYHKTSDLSTYLSRIAEEKKYVMDVILKREYAEGFIGNAEVAGGTEERYIARLFAMRYTDNSRLTLYGNSNNVNENRHPGANGEWTPANQPQGRHTLRTAGLDLIIDQADKKWTESLWTQISWTKNRNETLVSAENFLADNSSIFSRNHNQSVAHNLYLDAKNNFTLKKPFYMEAFVETHYSKRDNNNLLTSMQTDADIEPLTGGSEVLDSLFSSSLSTDLQHILINRNRSRSHGNGYEYYAGTNINSTYKLPWGDEVGLLVNAGYQRKNDDNFSFRHIDYMKGNGKNMLVNRYGESPQHFYRFTFSPRYTINWLNGVSLTAGYGYNQRYDRQQNSMWLGDSIDAEVSDYPFADLLNSYDRGLMHRQHSLRLTPSYTSERNGTYINIHYNMELNNVRERLHYMSEFTDTVARLSRYTFLPNLSVRIATHNWMRQVYFSYRMEMRTPDLYRMINIRNDENPLAVVIGNPDLKTSVSHLMQTYFSRRWKEHQQSHTIGYGLRFFNDKISTGYTYDGLTGIYTYRPVNVKGEWQTYFWNSFNRSIDKHNRLMLSNYTHGDYSRNVDVAQTLGNGDENGLSHVNNWYIENRLTLNYRYKDLSLGAQGYVEYRHASSVENTFENINALNYSYGVTFNYNFKTESLPLVIRGFSLSTDIKMYGRQGYGDKSIDKSDLVWNASFSRTFPIGKTAGSLTARIEGFDLLSQLSNTNIVINGQGRTVTVSNSLPRYIMLHLTYNFKKMPKKR